MRVVKDADERKKEILIAAGELFSAKGYDETSTNDILKKTGIARGTLYYHFKSKEEILDSLLEMIMEGMMQKAEAAVSSKKTTLDKIMALMSAMKVDSGSEKGLVDEANKPHNALMHQKMQDILLKRVIPFVAGMIREGVEAGELDTDHPEEAAEMLLLYSSIVFDDRNELSEKETKKKAAGFVYNMERLLGVPSGSFSKVAKKIR